MLIHSLSKTLRYSTLICTSSFLTVTACIANLKLMKKFKNPSILFKYGLILLRFGKNIGTTKAKLLLKTALIPLFSLRVVKYPDLSYTLFALAVNWEIPI